MQGIAIGPLSYKVGVKIPTIRYYESIGLLPTPTRTQSGRRTYMQSDIDRLNFVRHARDLGFSIEDIRALVNLTANPKGSCHAVDSIARRNLHNVERKITALKSLRTELKRMIDTCVNSTVTECRVIQVLSDHEHCHNDEHLRP